MRILGQQRTSRAFALPTVLIASVVLLSILAVSVTATATVRTALQSQYYVQLAQVAGEAGVAEAKACLAANGNVPLWTNAKPLTPATDCSGNQILTPNVKALVVAGGGSGGGSTGGGGGGGGVVYTPSVTISATTYTIAVGAGGGGTAQQSTGISGGNSSFNGITAIGGGGGGYSVSGGGGYAGLSGGSGGGGQTYVGNTAGGAGTAGQGNNGSGANAGQANTGGGGGAGGPGGMSGVTSSGGPGGLGLAYNISGSMVYYGAGGGGGNGAGAGGVGGSSVGGTGAKNGTAGAANTGSGGGGGWDYAGGSGGAGAAGVVIISYPVDSGIVASGSVTPTVSGGNKIFKFTASAGTFTVSSTGTTSCPSDPRCSVTVNGNVRSSFTVGKPTVDSNGRALTIPNSGYVEITRTSSGSVWRTYKQPAVQSAVVPDLCSGNATAARGWGQAVLATQQDSLASASSAQSITISNAAINAGSVYYRKDFNASANASYDFNIYTPGSNSSATAYMDGTPIATTAGNLTTASTTLTAGCHTLVVKDTNQTYLPQSADFTASLTRSGAAAPIVVSDTSWRVSSGDAVHFSTNNYQETTGAWEPVAVLGIWNNTALPWAGAPTNWAGVSFDPLTEWVSTNYGSPAYARPANQTAWFRQSQPFTTTTPLNNVQISNYCDDTCDIYLDGNFIMTVAGSQGVVTKTISIQPGTHTFGIRLNNADPTASGFLFTAYNKDASAVIARSDASWDATTSWSTQTTADLYSYDATFTPTPAIAGSTNAKILVVGGGGGGGSDMGGGGGGGGVVYNAAYPLTVGTYNVNVGNGGIGAAAGSASARGGNGGNSTFDKLRAYGGGGGGSNYAANTSPPGSGASAGGSAAYLQTFMATNVIGQGNNSVATAGAYYPTGGGGAGGAGATNVATGGIGVQNSILGTNFYWGGGGGGSGYSTIGGNGGAGGGGGGAVGSTTGGSGVNNGSPGGGGVTVAQTNTPGGNGAPVTGGGGGGGSHYNSNNYGGNGGTGSVIISYPSGSLTATVTGSYVNYSSSTPGFTTYLFYGSGTLTVTSIFSSAVARNVNLTSPYSQWTLAGGATYSSATGQLTIPAAGSATSPLMRVDSPTNITIGGDFYSTNQATYAPYIPNAANQYSISYFAGDGVTPVANTAGYTANGCSLAYPTNAWGSNVLCTFAGGPSIIYVQYSLYGSNGGYASPTYLSQNPQLILQ